MTQYTSEYPSDSNFNPAYKTFFEKFYQISDTPTANAEWVNSFTPDATVIMASKKATGHPEITTMRESMWTKVSRRTHDPLKIYPFGPAANDVMIHGTVAFELKDGSRADKDWAAHARLVEVDGVVKMAFYQVYLDTA